MPHLFLAFAIIFEVIGTIALKWSTTTGNHWFGVLTFIAYCVSFFMLWSALKNLPLGMAYATWSGVGIALTTMIGILIFSEKLDLIGVLGLLLIISGVILINVFSSMGGN